VVRAKEFSRNSKRQMIAIIDYGASNLSSVAKAIISLGYQLRVASYPKEITGAKAVILPGVGLLRMP